MIRTAATVTGGPRAVARALAKAKRPELARIGLHWHQHILPHHFVDGAFRRYRYQRRSRPWNERKRRITGRAIELVFTGDLQRMVERQARITTTPKGARVAMTGPRYLYMYRKDANEPDKSAEITKTTVKEERSLTGLFDRRVTRSLNRNTTVERTQY